MIGLLVSVLWFMFVALFLGRPLGGYRDAAMFLSCWYVVTGALTLGMAKLGPYLQKHKLEMPMDRLPLLKAYRSLSELPLGRQLPLGALIITLHTFFLVGGASFLQRAAAGATRLSQLNIPSLLIGTIMITATWLVGTRLKPSPVGSR